MTRRLAIPFVAIVVLGSGCGGSDKRVIDHTVVETAIETSIAQQQHVIAVVSCPKGLEAKAGRRFSCTATFRSGQQAAIRVTAKGDKGAVDFTGLNGYKNGKPPA